MARTSVTFKPGDLVTLSPGGTSGITAMYGSMNNVNPNVGKLQWKCIGLVITTHGNGSMTEVLVLSGELLGWAFASSLVPVDKSVGGEG